MTMEADSALESSRVPRRDPDLAPLEQQLPLHRAPPAGFLAGLTDCLVAAAADLLALAVPADCVCCGSEDHTLCPRCARRIRRLTAAPYRAEAAAPSLADVDGSIILPVVAAGAYREELAQAVLSFKRHGQRSLRSILGRALSGALRAAAGEQDTLYLVPVPTSPAAYVTRGFSPVHLLLAEAARQVPEAVILDVLTKPGKPGLPVPGGQKGLDRGGRSRRVRGSMSVRRRARGRLAGATCIIVDDVLTTGATLAEAARALERERVLVAGAVVLAATRPPGLTRTAHLPAGSVQSHPDDKKINRERMNNGWL
jgi:predicted amidophosphoribosyltransferase